MKNRNDLLTKIPEGPYLYRVWPGSEQKIERLIVLLMACPSTIAVRTHEDQMGLTVYSTTGVLPWNYNGGNYESHAATAPASR